MLSLRRSLFLFPIVLAASQAGAAETTPAVITPTINVIPLQFTQDHGWSWDAAHHLTRNDTNCYLRLGFQVDKAAILSWKDLTIDSAVTDTGEALTLGAGTELEGRIEPAGGWRPQRKDATFTSTLHFADTRAPFSTVASIKGRVTLTVKEGEEQQVVFKPFSEAIKQPLAIPGLAPLTFSSQQQSLIFTMPSAQQEEILGLTFATADGTELKPNSRGRSDNDAGFQLIYNVKMPPDGVLTVRRRGPTRVVVVPFSISDVCFPAEAATPKVEKTKPPKAPAKAPAKDATAVAPAEAVPTPKLTMQVVRFIQNRTCSWPEGGGKPQVTVQCSVLLAAIGDREGLIEWKDATVSSVVSDRGEDLTTRIRTESGSFINPIQVGFETPHCPGSLMEVTVDLGRPAAPLNALAKLEGSLALTVATAPATPVVLKPISEVSGKPQTVAGLASPITVTRSGKEVTLEFPEALSDQIMGVSFSTAEGKEITIGGKGRQSSKGLVRLTYYLQVPDDGVMTILVIAGRRTVQWPFVLRDVSLTK